MFKGVIHSNARLVLKEFIPLMPKRVINICSGNFTLETVIRMNGYGGRLEGCDVSLYTSSLGMFYAGLPDLSMTLKDDCDPDMRVFEKHMGTAAGNAAVVAVALDLSEHHKRGNRFSQRFWKAIIGDADNLVTKTKARMETKRALIALNHFHPRDGVEVIKEASGDKETLIISSPPTYEGGYEKLYEWLEKQFAWKKPGYTDIGPAANFAKLIVESGCRWILFTEDQRPEVEAIVGKPLAQCARGPNKNVYLYSDFRVRPKLVRRRVETSDSNQRPRLKDSDEISASSKIRFHAVSFKEGNYFRQLYSSVIPMQASAPFCYQFSIDGKVFGQVMLSLATFSPVVDGKPIGGEYLYMMSDLPIESEAHPRLSKLVLACATAKEFRSELEHRTMQTVKWLFTTAFSKNPVSMKYRGAFDFHSRKQQPNGIYAINYVAETGKKGFRQILAEWHARQYLPTRARRATAAADESGAGAD